MVWGTIAATVIGSALKAKGAKDAAEESASAQKDAAGIIARQADEARKMIFQTVPIAERNLALGQQASLNVLGRAIAPQAQLARGGNIAAQETLIAGLPQMQSALLGRAVDMSQIQPYRGEAIPPIDYRLPQFESAITEEMREGGAEGVQIKEEITRAYQDILGRAPDPSGLEFYGNMIAPEGIASPQGIERMRESLLGSEEYRLREEQASQQQAQ